MFKKYDLSLKDEIEQHVLKLNYKEHNLSFTNMFLWKEKFKLHVYTCEDFIIVFSNFHDEIFALNPICTYDNIPKAINFLLEYFKLIDKEFKINNCVKIVKNIIEQEFEDVFEYTEDRDTFDYLYAIDKIKTYQGKKLQKKRNHVNNFLATYGGQYSVVVIKGTKVINDCIEYTKKWQAQKLVKDEYLPAEVNGTIDILNNFSSLSCEGVAIYINDEIQGFSIGTQLNDTTAVLNVEKANSKIVGLYPFLRQQLVLTYFDDLKYLNTEDDVGDENLRKSKLSYYPEYLVEKYMIRLKP
ncbi:MAG: DUF2156 domain-containing protein [Bacilli bacterium]